LFQHHALVYVALALAVALWWFVNRTGWGLAIRACGEEPSAAHAAGIDVLRTRWACVLWGGALAGAGGAYLSIAQIGNFVEDMVSGRGFIAIACVLYGRWNPLGVSLAALFFGAADAAQIRLQTLNPEVPYQFFVMMPYVLAVGALAFVSRRSRLPAALALPFTPPR
jgi:simple sugar transport system permease protein